MQKRISILKRLKRENKWGRTYSRLCKGCPRPKYNIDKFKK